MTQHRALFTAFLRTGLVGFGGGPSMIPLIHHEVVKRHQWLQEEDFTDVLAIANSLPGPIATKLPGYVGYRVAGISGCVLAVIAITVPMVIALIAALGAVAFYQDIAWIRGMAMGVVPVVAIMMLQLCWDFLDKSRTSLGWPVSLVMLLLSAGLILGLAVHPALIILTLLAAALVLPKQIRWPWSKKESQS